MAKKPERYQFKDGKFQVEVKVKSAMQLFDARDPAPFRERDLDDDFSEYILTSAEELGSSAEIKIKIHVADQAQSADEHGEIAKAIHAHFEYQADLKRMQLSKLFRTGQLFLIIGLVGLFSCLWLANFILNLSQSSTSEMLKIIKEGLVILGWVAMWKPFELVLFDWWPLYDKIRLFRRMEKAEVEVVYEAK